MDENLLLVAQYADDPAMVRAGVGWRYNTLTLPEVVDRVEADQDDRTPGWLPLWPVVLIVAGVWSITAGVVSWMLIH